MAVVGQIHGISKFWTDKSMLIVVATNLTSPEASLDDLLLMA
jgi:hypothetical protein